MEKEQPLNNNLEIQPKNNYKNAARLLLRIGLIFVVVAFLFSGMALFFSGAPSSGSSKGGIISYPFFVGFVFSFGMLIFYKLGSLMYKRERYGLSLIFSFISVSPGLYAIKVLNIGITSFVLLMAFGFLFFLLYRQRKL